MATESEQSKEFEPTQKKLDESRRKGDIPRSVDLTTAIGTCSFICLAIFHGETFLISLGCVLESFLRDAVHHWKNDRSTTPTATLLGLDLIRLLAPVFLLPGSIILIFLFATKTLLLSSERIRPKLERVSIIANARQKFGPSGWVEFLKSLSKLACAIILFFIFIKATLPRLYVTTQIDVRLGLGISLDSTVKFLTASGILALLIGLADVIWQNLRHRNKMRMSRQELKQENQEAEGDPHLKQRRRQKAHDIATNQMLRDIPQSQVVIVNPIHYAVALKWDKKSGSAPICVAKGVNEVALKIREIALQYNVPIHQDPATARALYATVEIGREIHPIHYPQVAAAIRFAENMRQKAAILR